MIVGAPGAGKTMLALQLVLQVTAAASGSVAVLLQASRWSGGSFEEWLAAQLTSDYGVPRRTAGELVEARRVIPVLDGLDELDPVDAPPLRAMDLLAKLNSYGHVTGLEPAPAVATCRTACHAELARRGITLEGAGTVQISPLDRRQIRAYLQARYPDGHPRQSVRDSVAGLLNGSNPLDTPWRLMMATTSAEAGRPVSAPEKLPETYVRSAAELSCRNGSPYSQEQVLRWLQSLAGQLRGQDLLPHLLWRAGGTTVTRIAHGLFGLLTGLIAMTSVLGPPRGASAIPTLAVAGLAAWWSARPEPAPVRRTSPASHRIPFALAAGCVIALITTAATALARDPAGFSPAVFVHGIAFFALGSLAFGFVNAFAVRTALAYGIAAGAVTSAITAVPYGTLEGIAVGLMVCVTVAVPAGLLAGSRRDAWNPVASPSDALRHSLRTAAASGFMIGLLSGVLAWLTRDLRGLADLTIAEWSIRAFAVGTTAGIAFALLYSAQVWIRSLIGNASAATRGLLPWRLTPFLDWACQAGLLRVSGGAYQFRHRELQDWLTKPSK